VIAFQAANWSGSAGNMEGEGITIYSVYSKNFGVTVVLISVYQSTELLELADAGPGDATRQSHFFLLDWERTRGPVAVSHPHVPITIRRHEDERLPFRESNLRQDKASARVHSVSLAADAPARLQPSRDTMPLDNIGKISAAFLAAYVPLAGLCLFLVFRYALRRDAGWLFLAIFSLSESQGQ